MRRIYAVYLWRLITRSNLAKNSLLVISTAVFFSLVSIKNVISNMPPLYDWSAFSNFSMSAVTNTESAVYIAVLVFVSAVIWYSRDISRSGQVLSGQHA